MPPEDPAQKYAAAWADYKRRRLIAYLVPAALLVTSWPIRNYSKTAPIVLFAASIVAWWVLQGWYERWPCPRCGKRFTKPGKIHTICINCGLDKATMRVR